LHQSQVSAILAAAVGAGPPPPPPHFVPDRTLAEGAPGGAVYLHPGAGKVKNRWPAERFGTTARELVRRGLDVQWIEGPQGGASAPRTSPWNRSTRLWCSTRRCRS